MRLYLDACCLNRPFDDQSQDRVRIEADAVEAIVDQIEQVHHQLITSEVVDREVARHPDPDRRAQLVGILRLTDRHVLWRLAEDTRAQELQTLGFDVFDAAPLACAESGEAQLFLTTDDQLLRCAERNARTLRVRVVNPSRWITEA